MKPFSFIILLLISFKIFGQSIPYIDKNEWKYVGIDSTKTITKPDSIYNVLKLNPPLIADGKTDNSSLLQAMINNVNKFPSPCVFYFPEGDYLFKRTIYLKNGRIIRGESAGKTNLIFDNKYSGFLISHYSNIGANNILNDIPKGSKILVVDNIKNYKPGTYIKFWQTNDSTIVDKKWERNWSRELKGMINKIDKIREDTLFLAYPTHIDFIKKGNNLKIKKMYIIENVGFENFKLKMINPKNDGHNFLFIQAANSWICGVESDYTARFHVAIEHSININVQHSYFHNSYNYEGGKGYGIECGNNSTNCLIEDNILDSLRHSMMVHLGANGNVFAYNYSTHPYWKVKNLMPPDISLHGHYPYANLFEGNIVQKILGSDYWGKIGPYNTLFRNRVTNKIEINEAEKTILIDNEIIKSLIYYNKKTTKNVLRIGNISKGIKAKNNITISSLFRTKKPDYFGKMKWPPIGNFNQYNSYSIPAKKRYKKSEKVVNCSSKKIKEKKKKGFFGRVWNWIKNIF